MNDVHEKAAIDNHVQAPSASLIREILDHTKKTWTDVTHGRGTASQYLEAGAEVAGVAIAAKFASGKLLGERPATIEEMIEKAMAREAKPADFKSLVEQIKVSKPGLANDLALSGTGSQVHGSASAMELPSYNSIAPSDFLGTSTKTDLGALLRDLRAGTGLEKAMPKLDGLAEELPAARLYGFSSDGTPILTVSKLGAEGLPTAGGMAKTGRVLPYESRMGDVVYPIALK